jgi:hypothetical protein
MQVKGGALMGQRMSGSLATENLALQKPTNEHSSNCWSVSAVTNGTSNNNAESSLKSTWHVET